MPYDVGHCYNYTSRWYYDHENGYCRQFYYGGCGGNENNFADQTECEASCHTAKPATELPETGMCQWESVPSICGEAAVGQWFYNETSNECLEFTTPGCLGRHNHFNDKYTCESTCRRSPSDPYAVTEGEILKIIPTQQNNHHPLQLLMISHYVNYLLNLEIVAKPFHPIISNRLINDASLSFILVVVVMLIDTAPKSNAKDNAGDLGNKVNQNLVRLSKILNTQNWF